MKLTIATSCTPSDAPVGPRDFQTLALQGIDWGVHFLKRIQPVLLIAAYILLIGDRVLAAPGGSIYGASNQTVGNALRNMLGYFRVVVFFAGVAFILAAGIYKGMEKPWGGKLVAGLMCFGSAAIGQLLYSFANDETVTFDPDLNH